MYMQITQDLVKLQILIQQRWDGASSSTFLTSAQGMSVLLVHDPLRVTRI